MMSKSRQENAEQKQDLVNSTPHEMRGSRVIYSNAITEGARRAKTGYQISKTLRI